MQHFFWRRAGLAPSSGRARFQPPAADLLAFRRGFLTSPAAGLRRGAAYRYYARSQWIEGRIRCRVTIRAVNASLRRAELM